MILYIVVAAIVITISARFYDFREKSANSSHQKRRVSNTPILTFTSSKDLINYYCSIVKYKDVLVDKFEGLDEDGLTKHQYEQQYYALVADSYKQLFTKFPQLVSIEEDKRFYNSKCYGIHPLDEFDSDKLEHFTFSRELILVNFEIKVKDLDYYVTGLSGKRNIAYHYYLNDPKRFDNINKGDLIRMEGYVDNVHNYDGYDNMDIVIAVYEHGY